MNLPYISQDSTPSGGLDADSVEQYQDGQQAIQGQTVRDILQQKLLGPIGRMGDRLSARRFYSRAVVRAGLAYRIKLISSVR